MLRTKGIQLEKRCMECEDSIKCYEKWCKKCRGKILREKAEELLDAKN